MHALHLHVGGDAYTVDGTYYRGKHFHKTSCVIFDKCPHVPSPDSGILLQSGQRSRRIRLHIPMAAIAVFLFFVLFVFFVFCSFCFCLRTYMTAKGGFPGECHMNFCAVRGRGEK